MNAIEQLLARDQIRQLAERYALAVDGKDLDSLAELFADDVSNGRYGPGRAGVRTFYDNRLRLFHCSMHLVGNHVIDFDDDEHAHGVVYCRAHHHVTEPEHWFDLALAYWDTYERSGDGWVFRRRRVKSWYRQEFGHPEHGTERVLAAEGQAGPMRGSRMPEGWPTFDDYWARPPAPLPGD
ncbi:nuclear transport factor 2 family protein [Frankia sp. AgB1.9]|uniref:nuclear transport factor 2 family protein n=1 Tax=unclassified Frankia TaxID=2632575 RepID=UPI00193299A6|nr:MULTISPECIES: nuclear transport factor 2 family protein [unclassified Frankia]MBL7488193.1 nuclear transport factor 2 family protein [Frankia sp. AgW1.1]MBL7551660.1 nuclear transport factor 2 family protein [Frankia sp. AgB1.9]MBL7620196.1 nuclear transport factor 2 family protein [Frankia sp. AgB1.8]